MHAPTHSHLSDHVTLASPIPVWLTMLTTCHWSGSRPVGKNSTAYRVCMALQWGRGSASGACSPVETWGPHSGIFSLKFFFTELFQRTTSQVLGHLCCHSALQASEEEPDSLRYHSLGHQSQIFARRFCPPLLPIALCERPVRRAGTLLSHPQCGSNSACSPSPTPPFPFLSPLSLHAQVRSVVPCLSEMEHPCSQALFHEISVCSTQGPCPLTHRCGTDVGSWYFPCHSPASPSCILALICQGSTWAVQP